MARLVRCAAFVLIVYIRAVWIKQFSRKPGRSPEEVKELWSLDSMDFGRSVGIAIRLY